MKLPLTILVFILFVSIESKAQLKAKVRCDPFEVDILNGKINNTKPNFGIEEIKATFPCFTASKPENGDSKCGGTVEFADKGLTYYTSRDYVEIKPGFKGKLSIPLLGAKRGSFFKTFGNPKIKDDSWDAYQMSYGTLVLHYDKAGKVNLIQIATVASEALMLCE